MASTPRRILAFVLGAGLLIVGAFGGLAAGAWPIPIAVALAHGGVSELSRWPIRQGVFPGIPEWATGTAEMALGLVPPFFAIAGMGAGAALALQAWRYIMVKRLHWMTDDEVDEVLKRDPGF